MDFRILGPLEVLGDEGALKLGGPKEQALLALLVVHANRLVPVHRIIDELWGDAPPPSAINTVRSHVSRLRKRLSIAQIQTDGPGYVLVTPTATIDSTRFETHLERGLAHRARNDRESALNEFEKALSQWRGSVLSGLERHAFAMTERTRLEARKLETIVAEVRIRMELGQHQRLVSELEVLVDANPHHEDLWRQLMLALYRSGRQADSLAAYRRMSNRLGDELGIEPTEETRSLEERILLQDPALQLQNEHDRPRHNIPASVDSFVGRGPEIAEIENLLNRFRCVTLTGVGGAGKTRIAAEASRRAAPGYRDGACWVELAPVRDEDALAEQILLAFGDPGSHATDPIQLLSDVLRHEQLLLVLDNCEHLISAVASLVNVLLRGCPELTVIATSREALGIAGEGVFHVPALGLPNEGAALKEVAASESVNLLVERVRSHDHAFELDIATAPLAATICTKLDGMPLAIELAAGRLRTMSIVDLVGGIDNRLELLAKGHRAAPPRHKTLRATVEWSYELLTDKEKEVFRRLGVFIGSWSATAAAEITGRGGETNDLVEGLVEKCLVEQVGNHRFRLLEIIREFAFEQLVFAGNAPEVGRLHRDWYLGQARRLDPELRGPNQVDAWSELEEDHDNIRAALRWSIDHGEPEGALELVAAMGYFWMVRAHWREAWRWLQRSLDIGGSPLARAHAVTGEAITEVIRVNFGAVDQLLEEATVTLDAAADDAAPMAHVLRAVGGLTSGDQEAYQRLGRLLEANADDLWLSAFILRYLGESSEAAAIGYLEESYDRFMELGDRWNAAFSKYFISGWQMAMGDLGRADDAALEARQLATEVGDLIWYAHATRNLGLVALRLDDEENATRHMKEALEILTRIGDDACSITLNRGLATLSLKRGAINESIRLTAEALKSAIKLEADIASAVTLWRVAEIAAVLHDLEAAVRFSTAAETTLEGKSDLLGPTVSSDLDTIAALIAERISNSDWQVSTCSEPLPGLVETLGSALAWCESKLQSASSAVI